MRTHKTRSALAACVIASVLLSTMLVASYAFADADDNIPGQPLALSTVTSGSLNTTDDPSDVYAFYLSPGQTIVASMTGEPGTDFDLYLYPPSAKSVGSTTWWFRASTASSSEWLSFMAPVHGTYYLQVHDWAGSGNYAVEVHLALAVKFKLSAVSAPKSAKKGKYVKVSIAMTPAYNGWYSPIKFYFYRYENRKWKLKATRWATGVQYVGYWAKSLSWANYKFPKKGSWRIRAHFWDEAHMKGMNSAYKKITIK